MTYQILMSEMSKLKIMTNVLMQFAERKEINDVQWPLQMKVQITPTMKVKIVQFSIQFS